MSVLFKAIFFNTIKMRSVWLYWILGLMPFIVAIAMSINSSFLQISGETGTLSGLEFFSMIYGVLHNMLFPTIVLAFIISKLFYDELNSGLIFMYKDINKYQILLSKFFSLLCIQLIYILILFLSSVIIYFTFISNYEFSSGHLMPIDKYMAATIVPTLTLYFIEVLTINFSILFSLHFSTGITIFGIIFFILFTTLAPMLDKAKYIVPNGYDEQISSIGAGNVLLLSFVVFLIYYILTTIYIFYRHNNIEY